MPFLTNLAPGAAGYDDLSIGGSHRFVVVTATAGDGRIFFNWQDLGQGWQGWLEMAGGGRTDATPAVSFTIYGDVERKIRTWSAVKGLDENIYVNNSDPDDPGEFGTSFGSWVRHMDLQTSVAPAGTVDSNGVWPIGAYSPVLVAVGLDGRVYYNNYSGWLQLDGDGRTDAAVAAALVGNNYLFVVAKGLDGQLYLNQGELGALFTGWHAIGFSSNVAPAASSNNNVTALVATGTDGRIYYDWWARLEEARMA